MVLSSESFARSPEFELTSRLIGNSARAMSFSLPGIVHQSFSDTPCLLPQFIGKRVRICGALEIEASYQAQVDAINAFMAYCEGHSSFKQTEALIASNPNIQSNL